MTKARDNSKFGNFAGNEVFLDSDKDTSITADTDDQIDIKTGGTDRVHIDSSGNVGIGTSSPIENLEVVGKSSFGDNITSYPNIISGNSPFAPSLRVARDTSDSAITIERFNAAAGGPFFHFGKGRSGTYGDFSTVVSNGDDLGSILFSGSDGDQFRNGALIRSEVDGTAGNDDMPGRIIFATTADGSYSPTERMRINSSGTVSIGTTDLNPADNNVSGTAIQSTGFLSVNRDNAVPVFFGRTNDGVVVRFFSAGTTEGSISISGTTVSYNGGHLSRWGRLSDGSQPTILKGTVMSNLDEMVVWEVDGVAVENEQRNQLKVSDVEGDINVAGLFVKWDTEEDEYNDIDLAMTGDMIIRIAQGTTVQRGDLLMSAGDGTAKPQGDDIVRSKTIAKVTSTTVINTYDDGSYVVPCVVMAC